jgi:hypothetical protein
MKATVERKAGFETPNIKNQTLNNYQTSNLQKMSGCVDAGWSV